MKVLIVEDEPQAAERLTTLLQELKPEAQVLAKLDTVKRAVAWLKGNPTADLAFFDIQLADGLSFEIFEQVEVKCPIIFTTAYNEYALKAFKVNSIDYILKPVDKDELKAAFLKYDHLVRTPADPARMMESITYAMQMLTTLLSGGQSSRFQKEIVDNKQLAAFVGSFPFALEDGGLFITLGLVNMGKTPEELEAAIEAEINRVKNEPIPDKEFQKLRNQLENTFISSNSSVEGIAESLADYHVYFGDANLINTEIDRYMAVTKEDIMRVAKKYLTPENRVTLTYLPKSAQKTPENQQIKSDN